MNARASIQRFQILARIGEGGMGTVYRARDPQLERDVAIKVLHDAGSHVRAALTTHHTVDLRGRGGIRKRDDLLQEARMMARLSHPNVVSIFEVGLDEAGEVFVVMEYVAGEDLHRWLKTERSTIEISRALAQAGRGLAEAHARGIVHRDFKPDNVLIGGDARARVTDFGLSGFAEPVGLVTMGKVAGTPKYMAPELWRGEPATPASDVFALCTTALDALGDRVSAPLRSFLGRGVANDATSIFPADHSAVIEARVDLGITLARASQFEAAHRELGVAVALADKSEAMRRSYPWMLSRLAMATGELGRSDQAAQLYEQAIELLASTVGVDHPQTVNQRFNHGALFLELGRLDDADRVVRMLEQSFARRVESSDNRPALLRGWLGSGVALARGQPKAAEALARRAIDELTELGGDEELAIARRHLGDALVGQGRFGEARPILEAALASARALNLRADDVAAYEIALAIAEHGLGQRDAARARATRLKVVLERYPATRITRQKVERLLKRDPRRPRASHARCRTAGSGAVGDCVPSAPPARRA